MDFETDIQEAVRVMRQGGIILYPTDTVWGLGCDATNEEAVDRIYRLKNRADSKSMIVLVAEENDILRHVPAPDLAVFDYLEAQTRPTTVIYENVMGLASNVVAADGSAGMRITTDAFCRALIKRLRKPVVSTSANSSGQPAPARFNEINPLIINGVDYVVRHRQEDTTAAQPSLIIKWTATGVEVIRG